MAGDTTTELRACLERLRAGDPQARGMLITRACDRLRRLTRKMLRDFDRIRAFEQADDVLHNAVVRLLRALEVVSPGSPADFFRFAAYAIRCELINLSRHYFGPHGPGRHEKPVQSPADDSSAPRFDAPAASTLDVERLAAWTEFHRHVEGLPDQERAVFDLLYYQGLSQADAAALLGVSVPTVKRRWMVARLRLQEKFPFQVPLSWARRSKEREEPCPPRGSSI